MTLFAKTADPSQGAERPARRSHRRETQKGFTLPELVVTLTAVGAIMSPVLNAVDSSMDTIRAEQNQTYLEMARESLIRYAARNNGCLPYAADWEGALPNTDQNGSTGYTDTGISKDNGHAGDLPWTDLGLGDTFRDGDGLRIQYFVATQYADFGSGCEAGAKGENWNPSVSYEGTVADPVYLYYTPLDDDPGIYEVDGALAAGTSPVVGGYADVGAGLPPSLLELRRGPDINANGSEGDILSAQNVFVLIATGDNINANTNINLPHMRDDNHRSNGGGAPWNLNQSMVNKVRFSATHEFNSGDDGTSGDDTLLVTSFLSFKSDLRSFGVKLKSIF